MKPLALTSQGRSFPSPVQEAAYLLILRPTERLAREGSVRPIRLASSIRRFRSDGEVDIGLRLPLGLVPPAKLNTANMTSISTNHVAIHTTDRFSSVFHLTPTTTDDTNANKQAPDLSKWTKRLLIPRCLT